MNCTIKTFINSNLVELCISMMYVTVRCTSLPWVDFKCNHMSYNNLVPTKSQSLDLEGIYY